MQTPRIYWRIAAPLAELDTLPATNFTLPACLSTQKKPPAPGDGLILADYDRGNQKGLVRILGTIQGCQGDAVDVDWRKASKSILVNTGVGQSNWTDKKGFKFAPNQVAEYGLHRLFADTFPGLISR